MSVVKLDIVKNQFDADAMLEEAKDAGFATTLAIVGYLKDHRVCIMTNANKGEAVLLLEQAKHTLLFDDE